MEIIIFAVLFIAAYAYILSGNEKPKSDGKTNT